MSNFIRDAQNHCGPKTEPLGIMDLVDGADSTENRRIVIVSKTLRRRFLIGLLIWKLQLGVQFYSDFDDFGLLQTSGAREGIHGVVILQSAQVGRDTSTLDDKTDPRSIGAPVPQLGVKFYSQ